MVGMWPAMVKAIGADGISVVGKEGKWRRGLDISLKNNLGKKVLVTGTSTGIGRCVVHALTESGFTVFAGVRTDADQKALLQTQPHCGRLHTLFLDITDDEQVQTAVGMTEKLVAKDGLFALVNNAGISVPGAVECVPLDEFRRAFEVNLIGQLRIIQAFLPLIRRGKGRIIQVSSALGRLAMPLSGPYASSKYALEGMTDALRRELKPWGIRVSLIEPGSVRSAIWDKIDAQVEAIQRSLPGEMQKIYAPLAEPMTSIWKEAELRAVSPRAAARAVLHALNSRHPRTRYLVGRDAYAVAALSMLVPARAMDRILKGFLSRIVSLPR